ncbi:hypothetical protein DCS_00337 [Drechmeria coniospora]|uniref:Uncharacterized protein n=1 Tax=Drechmeria coniospora TaxID=98403 RepID=A0A151GQ17_DRECN|nr:hypothetical protein DCS_00337 [Drechmeria coniospora]KYK59207.1 hypothetical protein DCS_00337 [Drechmeria coniospora]
MDIAVASLDGMTPTPDATNFDCYGGESSRPSLPINITVAITHAFGCWVEALQFRHPATEIQTK